MRILFVHQNFPGQFVHLARELAARGHEVRALTLNEGVNFPDVELAPYKIRRSQSPDAHWLARDFETKVIRGEACAQAAQQLKAKGFKPDVICAHPGWGEALFLKDVFPSVPLLGYLEYFYRATGQDFGFDPEFPAQPEDAWRVRLKNSMNLQALNTCDALLTPTEWQRCTFPSTWREQIQVIHEGVDTQTIKPAPDAWVQLGDHRYRRDDELITFVARNLEPYRGFHIFMRALPELLRRHPRARVLIVGGDGVSYGLPPGTAENWRTLLLREIGDTLDLSRVFFLGWVSYDAFIRILRVSSVHVYLTYPFVLSWSLLEAMASECAIVGSRTGPVEDAIADRETGLLVGFFDQSALVDAVSELLGDRALRARMGANARQHVQEHFDLRTRCLPDQLALISTLASTGQPR